MLVDQECNVVLFGTVFFVAVDVFFVLWIFLLLYLFGLWALPVRDQTLTNTQHSVELDLFSGNDNDTTKKLSLLAILRL